MDDFKGTPGPWVADIRGGCAAIYPERLASDTNGCHRGDSRNIAYSDKGAHFNGRHWEIDPAVAHDFMVMAAAPELLKVLQKTIDEIGHWLSQQKPELRGEMIAVIAKARREPQ